MKTKDQIRNDINTTTEAAYAVLKDLSTDRNNVRLLDALEVRVDEITDLIEMILDYESKSRDISFFLKDKDKMATLMSTISNDMQKDIISSLCAN